MEAKGKTWSHAAGSKGKEKTKLRKHSQLEASLQKANWKLHSKFPSKPVDLYIWLLTSAGEPS